MLRGKHAINMTSAPTAAVLVALMAKGFAPQAAWLDGSGWTNVPEAALQGLDGCSAEGAIVKARWNERWLFIDFECGDRHLVAPGKTDGLDHYKLGDVVEVFVARSGKKNYVEVHATPAGKKTAYFFDDYRKAGDIPEVARHISVRADHAAEGWRAVIAIPWSALGGDAGVGSWEIFAGRYDYDTPGSKPVLSSFPAQHSPADFHDRSRFARLELRR